MNYSRPHSIWVDDGRWYSLRRPHIQFGTSNLGTSNGSKIWSLTQDHQHQPGSFVGSEIGVDLIQLPMNHGLCWSKSPLKHVGWDPIVRVITSSAAILCMHLQSKKNVVSSNKSPQFSPSYICNWTTLVEFTCFVGKISRVRPKIQHLRQVYEDLRVAASRGQQERRTVW